MSDDDDDDEKASINFIFNLLSTDQPYQYPKSQTTAEAAPNGGNGAWQQTKNVLKKKFLTHRPLKN